MKSDNTKFRKVLEDLSSQLHSNEGENREWFLRYFSSHKFRFLKDLELIESIDSGGSVLEVGSAPFQLLYCLNKLGYDAQGVDLDPERCSSFIAQNDLQVVACDIEKKNLKFNDNSQKLIIFNETIEHLRVDPFFALSEINRVLSGDGHLILTTPNLYSIKNVLRFLSGKGLNDPINEYSKLERIGHMGHVREYSRKELISMLNHTGFSIKKHSFEHYSQKLSAKIFYSIFRAFRPYQIIVAEKS
jgi:SAM-dependent methyltransferase